MADKYIVASTTCEVYNIRYYMQRVNKAAKTNCEQIAHIISFRSNLVK